MDRIDDIDPDDIEIPDTSVFKTMGPDPLHRNQRLRWDHKVQLIGEKVVDPLIYSCEKCCLPTLIYGRLIPCKHVFCYNCGKKMEKVCTRCGDAVLRIEKSALGTVFICTWGHSKHDVGGCRRTYLSKRDLSAHINYRHKKQPPADPKKDAHVSSQSISANMSSSTTSGQATRSHLSGANKHLDLSRQKQLDEPVSQQSSMQNLTINTHHQNVAMGIPGHPSPVGIQQQRSPALQPQGIQPPSRLQSPQQGHMPRVSAPGLGPSPRPTGVPPHSTAPPDTFPHQNTEGRGHTNLITVQIQDDQDYRRQQSVDIYQTRNAPPVQPGYPMASTPQQVIPPPGFQHNPPISVAPGSIPRELQPGHFIPQSAAPTHHGGVAAPGSVYQARPDAPGQMHLGQGPPQRPPPQRPPPQGPAGQMIQSGPPNMMQNPGQQMPPRPIQMPPGQPPMQPGMPPLTGQMPPGPRPGGPGPGPRPVPHGQIPNQPPQQGQMQHPLPGGPPLRLPMQQPGPGGQPSAHFPNQQPGGPPPFGQHHEQRMQWNAQNRVPVPMPGPPVGGPPLQGGVPQLPPPRTQSDSGPYSQYY